MNARHVLVLSAVAVVAIAAALWTTSLREPAGVAGVGTPLLEGLEAQVNEVTAVHIYADEAEPAVTLKKGEASWQVVQKAGYTADTGKVRQLLLGLAEARLLEEKTSNPEYYARIGVQDVGDGANVRLVLEGVEAPGIIIGNSEAGRDAVYVRRADEATSWLASGSLDPEADPLQWLDRDVIDIPASRIASIEIVHPGGERLQAAKSSFGQPNFEVEGVPEQRELARPNVADPIAGALAGLRFDDVLPADEFAFPDETVTTTLSTFDGLVIIVDVAAVDNEYYARLSARTDAGLAQRYHDQQSEDAVSETPDAAAAQTGEPADAHESAEPPAALDLSAAEAEASEIVAQHRGWVYRLPKHKYDQLSRRLEDLLAAEAE